MLKCDILFIDSGNIGYSTGGSDVVRGAGILREDPNDDDGADDDDDDDDSGSEPLQRKPQRKDSPPSYNDHCMYINA